MTNPLKSVLHPDTLTSYRTAEEAYEQLVFLYRESCEILRQELEGAAAGIVPDKNRISTAVYPYLAFEIPDEDSCLDSPLSYGAACETGFHGATITSPELFKDYLIEQIQAVLSNYNIPVMVAKSYEKIPLIYAIPSSPYYSDQQLLKKLKSFFYFPDLHTINDDFADDEYELKELDVKPLKLFTASRVDYSLQRLHHYSGTSPDHFQRFIIFTNYQRYLPIFREYCRKALTDPTHDYIDFVAPGDRHFNAENLENFQEDIENLPQMPSYHLRRPDKNGISFVNIGVGPTNAKNITDHLAVLRPHCWLMIGHCAGLRRKQVLGDYVLAQAYMRNDGVLDEMIPLWTPIPPLAEVQMAIQDAFQEISGVDQNNFKSHFRTGTVATTHDRNWEIRARKFFFMLKKSRAVALDLESATIATNGFRYRVPYSSLLCVSDKPLHGELKAKGTATNFYKKSLEEHLLIGLKALEILRKDHHAKLHSRKLRGYSEVIFR